MGGSTGAHPRTPSCACTELSLLGREVRDLLRADWRPDFRTYVARALVGVGDTDVTPPMVTPCGEQARRRSAHPGDPA